MTSDGNGKYTHPASLHGQSGLKLVRSEVMPPKEYCKIGKLCNTKRVRTAPCRLIAADVATARLADTHWIGRALGFLRRRSTSPTSAARMLRATVDVMAADV